MSGFLLLKGVTMKVGDKVKVIGGFGEVYFDGLALYINMECYVIAIKGEKIKVSAAPVLCSNGACDFSKYEWLDISFFY